MTFNLEFYTHLKYHIIVGVENDTFRHVKSQKIYLSVTPFQEATRGYVPINEGINHEGMGHRKSRSRQRKQVQGISRMRAKRGLMTTAVKQNQGAVKIKSEKLKALGKVSQENNQANYLIGERYYKDGLKCVETQITMVTKQKF